VATRQQSLACFAALARAYAAAETAFRGRVAALLTGPSRSCLDARAVPEAR
jgi:hypothetical protein